MHFSCFLFLPVPSERIGLDSGACISTRQEEIRSNNKDLAGRPAIAVVTRNALRLFVSKRFGGQLPIVRHPGPYDRDCRPPATSLSGNHGSLDPGRILVGEFLSLLPALTCKYHLNFDFLFLAFGSRRARVAQASIIKLFIVACVRHTYKLYTNLTTERSHRLSPRVGGIGSSSLALFACRSYATSVGITIQLCPQVCV